MSEKQKIRLCFEWLSWCFDNGWPKPALDELEASYWRFNGWETFRGYRR